MEPLSSFSGMTLTEIFDIQPLQSLFIKFWYLGLTSQSITVPEDAIVFRAIRKTLTFANCFSYELPIRTYIVYADKIIQAIQSIDPQNTFDVLLSHLRNNKVSSVSFQLFGVAFLQLFGRVLEILNTNTMGKLLRKIFLEITVLSKSGVSTLKAKGIKPIVFDDVIPQFKQLLEQKASWNQNKTTSNPEQIMVSADTLTHKLNMNTLKGRLELQRSYNLEMRDSDADQYPIGDKMRGKDKTEIACFMMGGFQIVDYSDSINQLHKKLLAKILLNK